MPGVAAGRVALVGSMSELIETLLAETPRVVDPERQQMLTARFLTPALGPIEALFLRLRAELDPVLRAQTPAGASKPYPLGQCLTITEAVRARLASLDPGELSGPARDGHAALRAFLDAGGRVRRAWGDLRGRYFQNALIVGALYVDVSNDTVVIDKPPVEIRPFAEAEFGPVTDYRHFARIAEGYWGYRFLPNHLVPDLAPYLPLIQIGPDGRLSLGPSYGYMLGLTLAEGFRPSERALAAPPPPPGFFASLAAALAGGPARVAADPDAGRAAALARCRSYRAAGRAGCAEAYNRARLAGQAANQRLARLQAIPAAA